MTRIILRTEVGKTLSLGSLQGPRATVRVQNPRLNFTRLFSDGRQGNAGIPALGNMWQDAARTIPAGPGDPVWVLDSPITGRPAWVAADAARRPLARRAPKTGVRNLFGLATTAKTSENFGVWGLAAASTTRQQVAGRGPFAQGWQVVDTLTSANGQVSNNVTPITAQAGNYVYSVFFGFDAANPPSTGVSLLSMQGTSSAAVSIFWNPDGTVANVAGASPQTAAVGLHDLGGGLYRAWARANFPAGGNTCFVWPAGFAGSGTSTGGIIVYAAQVERSDSGPSAYQNVLSANNVTEAGVRDCYGLRMDGIDDRLTTAANINFTTVTRPTLVVGATKDTDANTAVVLGHGNNVSGLLRVSVPGFSVPQWHGVTLTGSTFSNVIQQGAPAPDTALLQLTADRSGAAGTHSMRLQYNGTRQPPTTNNLPNLTIGPFLNTTASIGSRTDGGLPMQGTIWGACLASLSDAERDLVAAAIAANTPEVNL